jgi:hypothetical protein
MRFAGEAEKSFLFFLQAVVLFHCACLQVTSVNFISNARRYIYLRAFEMNFDGVI